MASTMKLLAAIMFGAVNAMGDYKEPDSYKPSDECYNTIDKNPCTAANRARNKYYFPSCRDECNFIKCDVDGNAFEWPCPPGTVWDPVAYTCNHDLEGKCTKYTPEYTPDIPYQPSDMCYDTKYKNPCTESNIRAKKLYFPSCTSECNFIQCDKYGGVSDMPCAPGTVWDPVAYTCNHDLEGKCPKYTPDTPYKPLDMCYDTKYKNPCTESNIRAEKFYFPSCTSECNFIQCDEYGGVKDMPCAPGTIWDQQKLTCVHDLQDKCPKKQEYYHEEVTTKKPYEPSDMCYDTMYNNPCSAENRDYYRERGQFYFKSCSGCCNFIQCDNFGKARDMQCPAGTYWDQQAYTCNHNYGQCKDASCRKKVTPSPTMWKTTEKPTQWTSTKNPTKWTTTEKPTRTPTKRPTQWTKTPNPTNKPTKAPTPMWKH